ncbi:hypothetical protein AMTR_s00047p00016990 [Amborella trichopoda]|uniref:Uncharacterized protein n=1 Tax=Amborella trichopoda TaxID=13333 RepID=U5D5K3_AMBTC|nr:hypothetical protein AMTR_s00047p00016990 [Amborella trichopoda]
MLRLELQLLKALPLSDLPGRIEAFKECAYWLRHVHADGELFDRLGGMLRDLSDWGLAVLTCETEVLTSYKERLATLEKTLANRCVALEESEWLRAQCLSEQVCVSGEIANLSSDIQTTEDEIRALQARVAHLKSEHSSREEAVRLCSQSLEHLEPEVVSASGLVDAIIRDIIELEEWKDKALHGAAKLGDKIKEAFDCL